MKTSFQKQILCGFGLVAALFVSGVSARAGVMVSIGNVTAAQGTSGSFDVAVIGTGPDASIGSFGFEISVPSLAGIKFTSVTSDTVLPYIFSGNSAFGPNIVSVGLALALPGEVIGASDVTADFTDVVLDTVHFRGLGRVYFDVESAAAIQAVAVTISVYPGSSFATAAGEDVPIDSYENGQITVTEGVPEPGSAGLVVAGLGMLAMWGRRARASLMRNAGK